MATAIENNNSIDPGDNNNKRKNTLEDCAFTEQHSNFLERTRLFTKKRKGWEGKKKPEINLQGNGTTASEQKVHNKMVKEFYKGVKLRVLDDDDVMTYKSYSKRGGDSWKYSFGQLFTCPYCYQSYTSWKKHGPVCTEDFKKNPDKVSTKTEEELFEEFELELGL